MLVGQEQHLARALDTAVLVERPRAAAVFALDEVQIVPPWRPVNALMAAEEFM